MADKAVRREDALRSAFDRLNVPMILCDEHQILMPLNVRGQALFELESLSGDLLTARPSHPLSRLIEEVNRMKADETVRRMITFPSGKRYIVESSARSAKGPKRWLVLLIQPQRSISVDAQTVMARWSLTERESDVAKLIVRGLSNREIGAEIGVSPETVKTHVRAVFEKSGTHSRAEFVAEVFRTR